VIERLEIILLHQAFDQHEKREKEGSEKGKSFAQSRKLMAAVAGVLVLAILGGTVGVSLSQQHKNAAAVEKYGSNVLKLYLPGEYLGENVRCRAPA